MTPILGITASSITGQIFNPNSISGLKMWYDANDSSTLTIVSGKASAITNKGSTNTTLSQGTSAKQPEVITNGQNGKQILRFTTGNLEQRDTLGMGTGVSNLSMFLAYKVPTGGSTWWVSGSGYNTGNNGGFPLMLFLSSNKTYFETGSGGNATTSTNTYVNTPIVQVVTIGGSARYMGTYTDNTTSDTQTGGNSPAYNTSVTTSVLNTIGLDSTIDFYEALYYDSVLSNDNIEKVVKYLVSKWGI